MGSNKGFFVYLFSGYLKLEFGLFKRKIAVISRLHWNAYVAIRDVLGVIEEHESTLQ